MSEKAFAVAEEIVIVPNGLLLDNPLNKYLRGETITAESCAGLVASIRENGVTVPLLITPYRQAFYLVHGHRRRFSARLAGLTELPCIIKELTADQQFNLMINENVQRENLTLLAEARCYQKLSQEGKSNAAISRQTGVEAQRLKLLLAIINLEREVQDYFERQKLPLGAARYVARITCRDTQINFAREAAKHRWTLDAIEKKSADWSPRAAEAAAEVRAGRGKRRTHGQLVGIDGTRLTKKEALEKFSLDDTFSVRDLKRGIQGSCCDECDEARFPDICRACPISQMLATLLEAKSALTKETATNPANLKEVSRVA